MLRFTLSQSLTAKCFYELTDLKGDTLLQHAGYASKNLCLDAIADARQCSGKQDCFLRKMLSETNAFGLPNYYFELRNQSGTTLGISKLYTSVISRDSAIAIIQREGALAEFIDKT